MNVYTAQTTKLGNFEWPEVFCGKEKIALCISSNVAQIIVTKLNQHSALFEAADLVGKANMRLLEAQRRGDNSEIENARIVAYCELDRLAAVLSVSEVAK